ncbi:Mce family protein [Mycobacteroides abscessus subsp. massiliense]|uniref:MlaD family protein n=1 Tax=Mycobacteroides abscessus TaxID=36809 RepID=UPI0009A7E9F3|nr:MlaD family protein [Mycobacteroides abscessus]SKT94706.1 Mce family protein [Mycobacteroides abscessus subsp. massiliense]
MLSRRTTYRRFSRIVLAVVCAGAVGSCSVADRAEQAAARSQQSAGYCAILSDSIGLYPGNSISRRGVPIGRVERVDIVAATVRVTFALDRGVVVPGGVGAVTRSTSILADRSLELTGGDATTGELMPGRCIPFERTATAKSMTEGIAASTSLINQLSGTGREGNVNRLMRAVGGELRGKGEVIRDTMSDFTGALAGQEDAPFDADGLVGDLAVLMRGIDANWAELATLMQRLPSGLDSLSLGLFQALRGLIGPRLNPLMQVLLDMATHLRSPVWNTLDAATATVKLLAEHTGVIVMYAGTLPNILDGIRNFWARVRTREIPVISPRVEAGPSDNGTVCSRTNLDPQQRDHCGFFYGVPDGVASTDILQLVLNGGVKQP